MKALGRNLQQINGILLGLANSESFTSVVSFYRAVTNTQTNIGLQIRCHRSRPVGGDRT